ncbi:PQQ-binding-like beta-propeller repeat protein [Cohnella sp. CFH 77786]|uniref:outer membrane protein assembly factor BamB family protein n=1 Tax=Cohnella sp. CFH 77786 TaxID=2662265 RepID=UPI001C60920A|nr:PQQ-binding-like beta-propeller repeat protein [Cohnella sp. CFH 77786]MBW5444748.1 PQQ-binding-like beta-propeller repeat protein [Cohnella sp. CFH 77786]
MLNGKKYGWIAPVLVSLGVLISGCGNNNKQAESNGNVQAKAIEGISNVAWKYEDFQSPPLDATVTEKYVYVGNNEKLYAIDEASGKKIWEHEASGIPSRPAVNSGIISFLDNTGAHALDAESGKLLWEHLYKKEVPRDMRPAEVAISSDYLFIPEQLEDGRITLKALDIKTGKESWSFGDSVSLVLSPYVADDKLYISYEGGVHILNTKSGKELDVIDHEVLISSVVTDNKLLVVSDLGGGVTAYDLKSKKSKWSYTNDSYDIKNRPQLTMFGNKVLLTEVKSGIVEMLDAENGKQLWSKTLGDPVFWTLYGGTITKPIVAEDDAIYLAVFDGQDNQRKGHAGYSTLLALDAETGNELWRYQEDDLIFYSPNLIENGMIVLTQTGIKAYQAGKNAQVAAQKETDATVNQPSSNSNTELVDLKTFEGQWSTPGSDELAINISITDDKNGVITYYSEGTENPVPFEFKQSNYDQLMLLLGNEERPLVLTYYESGKLGYKTNEQGYTLERSGVSQSNFGEAESSLIDGFKGKWCDSLQALCFEIKLEGNSGGKLDYYQERDPFQEPFRITYMDEYKIEINIDASKQATLELSDDKNTLTYETDSITENMSRQ